MSYRAYRKKTPTKTILSVATADSDKTKQKKLKHLETVAVGSDI